MTPSIPPYEIIIVPPGEEILREQCFTIRIKVFHHEQQFPLENEFDDIDPSATHFLLRLLPSHLPVGTVRVYRLASSSPSPAQYKLSRLCILKPHRHLRLGSALVQALHTWVQDDSSNTSTASASVIANSQIPAIPFYEKFGYKAEGDQFDEDGAPHQKMILDLSGIIVINLPLVRHR